ncbi:MAG: LptE family protein [Chlorobiaceae bacterium]|nr:LptE family protein [Chlorobiaceae bacterium]NTV59784.1 LptE family protein [Chlorobiaceae bacterium]
MQKTKTAIAFPLLILVLCVFQGCYSFSGSSIPAYLKTIAVPVFEDRSGAGIAQYRGELTGGIARKIESGSLLRTTPSMASADALLDGVIISYTDLPSQLSSKTERAVTNRITIVVEVSMEDRVKNEKVFFQTFIGFADYPVGNYAAQQQAIRLSINQIIDDIFDRIVSGW